MGCLKGCLIAVAVHVYRTSDVMLSVMQGSACSQASTAVTLIPCSAYFPIPVVVCMRIVLLQTLRQLLVSA